MANTSTFDIDGLRENEYVKVMIILPGTPQIPVSGYITQDFAFNIGTEYSSSADSSADTLNQGMAAVGAARDLAAAAGIGGGAGSQKVIRDMTQTVEKFSGFKKPTFTIPMVFIATKPTDDVRSQVRSLFASAFPNFTGDISRLVMEAPFGYHSDPVSLKATNTCSLQVGKWFRANNLLITDVAITFSKEVIRSGAPLYSKVDVTLIPYRLPTLDEALSYITG